MSITASYATAAEYRDRTDKTDTSDDALILTQLTAASRFFESRLGQFFNKDASAVVRLFRAKRSDCLDLDYEGFCPGIASTSGLAIKADLDGDGDFDDETAWSSDDYRLLPLQADVGPEPRPWNRIEVTRAGSFRFAPGNLVQVTAIYGWPSAPALIKELVIEWTAVWRGESIRTTARVNELDDVQSVSPYHQSQMKRIEQAYRRKVITF